MVWDLAQMVKNHKLNVRVFSKEGETVGEGWVE